MEKKKPGRPKTGLPTRSTSITLRLSVEELARLKKICYEKRVHAVDVLLKGIKVFESTDD